MKRIYDVPKTLLILPLLVSVLLLTLALSCSDKATEPSNVEPPNITGELVAHSECGGFAVATAMEAITTAQSAIVYNYDGKGTLDLRHINASFNCCPNISCEITIEGRTITVVEKDVGMCDCLCLTDADFRVTGLVEGTYFIKFVEPYLIEGDPKLEFGVRLGNSPICDTVMVERLHYPWHPAVELGGSLTAFSDCGGFDTPRIEDEPSSDSACVSWEYDQNGILYLRHHNAVFNCCPTTLTAVVTVIGHSIYIVEDEVLDNPCYCLCPYDLDMEIPNLYPATYDIVLTNPYSVNKPIEFKIDLVSSCSGYRCFEVAAYGPD